MPSGCSIVPYPTISTTQAALAIQVIGNINQYYLFSLEQYSGSINYCHLEYCIVDMSLNGGNGDVIASSKGKPIANNLSEKMIAILGNSGDIWLMTHKLNAAVFCAYHITSAGLNLTPVLSTTGTYYNYLAGVMRASPDRKKIVCQIDQYAFFNGTELYDFDASTGIVSNCQVLDTADEQYGAEFSPDNSKLFVHQENGAGGVYRYDLTLPATTDIIASKVLVHSGGYYKDLRLGPDSKIYLPNFLNSGLDCIANPNASGTAWGYTTNAVMLTAGSLCGIGLPNVNVSQWSSVGIINNNPEMALSVFPNPARDKVTIDATGLSGNAATINCYNTVGAIVAHKTGILNNGALNSTLNVSSLPKGIYQIRLSDDGGTNLARTVVLQ